MRKPGTMGTVARAACGTLLGLLLASGAPRAAAAAGSSSPAKRPATAVKSGAARPRPAPAGDASRKPEQIVRTAREFDDMGAYGRALAEWRAVRARVPFDGDLELATALDEARTGRLDSAAVRIDGPVLTAAGLDTLPIERYLHYGPEEDGIYLTGHFEGWHWYVWRARAEIALAQRRWDAAARAARRCVAARPLAGPDWLLLAVCAGQAGSADEARAAAQQAAALGGLPEAHYLNGLWAWRDGRRGDAQAAFRAAVAFDSTFAPAGLALVRSRLPAIPPDPLPATFLTGPREAGMLTSAQGPKIEQIVQLESVAILGHKEDPVVPDSLKEGLRGWRLPLWLLVDQDGRVVMNDLGWVRPGRLSAPLVSDLVAHLAKWKFIPPKIRGAPSAAWIDVLYSFAL